MPLVPVLGHRGPCSILAPAQYAWHQQNQVVGVHTLVLGDHHSKKLILHTYDAIPNLHVLQGPTIF
jgi:hypothetical protein